MAPGHRHVGVNPCTPPTSRKNEATVQPEKLTPWIPIVRDFAIVLLATFAIVFSIIWITDPTRLGLVLGSGLSLLGVPAALRVDAKRRKNEGEDDDRWSHLP